MLPEPRAFSRSVVDQGYGSMAHFKLLADRYGRCVVGAVDDEVLNGMTRFEGVPLEEVLNGCTGLYEVLTVSGVPVRLHDMSLVALRHQPAQRTLVMEFLYDEPQWTPDAARDTPLAIFAFDGVEVLGRHDEPAEPDTPAWACGQVQTFDYDWASGVFALEAYTTSWTFTARRLTLSLRALEEGAKGG